MKVTNGKDVARLLVDEYLNCHPTGHKKFMESMAKEQQEKTITLILGLPG